MNALLGAFDSDPAYRPHADALMPALLPLYEMLDPETYGGAMLLGVDGVCIISHGSSSERAIVNAIQVAREMVEADVVGEITEGHPSGRGLSAATAPRPPSCAAGRVVRLSSRAPARRPTGRTRRPT